MGKVLSWFFSPTHSSKKAARMLGEPLAQSLGFDFVEQSATLPAERQALPETGQKDILICAFPVYGGRMPAPFAAISGQLRGAAHAIPLAVYGNRAFDDALAECADLLVNGGFRILAGVAAIAEHTFAPKIATGRPNADDQAMLSAFAKRIAEKYAANPDSVPPIPGKRPYVQPNPLPPITPLTSEACNKCGICARICPVGVIDPENEARVSAGCLLCAACVKFCPQHAKSLPQPFLAAIREKLAAIAQSPREPQLFI